MTSASPFCSHRKLRTGCPECRPPPAPRAPSAPKPAAKPAAKRATAEKSDGTSASGKGRTEMLPRRSRPKRVDDRREAETAEAWWVKKG